MGDLDEQGKIREKQIAVQLCKKNIFTKFGLLFFHFSDVVLFTLHATTKNARLLCAGVCLQFGQCQEVP